MRRIVNFWALAAAALIAIFQFWAFSGFMVLKPGVAAPAGSLGTIEGAFPSGERLLYTAVIAQRGNLVEALHSIFDPNVRLSPMGENIPEGVGWREYSRLLERLMGETQRVAAAVAFREAGFRLPVTTEVVVDLTLLESPVRGRVPSGSVLTSVNGTDVHTEEAAYALLREGLSRGSVRLVILPEDGGPLQPVDVSLTDHPKGTSDALPLGLLLRTAHKFEYPMKLTPGRVEAGGSSAGLMLALELYDQLTGGGLAGNRVIAGTGAIRLDGTVESVDGIRQKVAAAKRAGASAFILPRGNVKDAFGASEGLMLLPVDTFTQAVEALRRLQGEE